MMNYLYLHGFCSGKDSFKGSYLRKKFADNGLTLQTPDLNENDFEHLTLTRQLHFLEKITRPLSGPITLLGSSMGGYIASLFAETHLQIQQLVLIAPAFQFYSRFIKQLDSALHHSWKTTGYTTVYHHAYNSHQKLHYGLAEDSRQYDQTAFKREIPALVIHGLADTSVSYEVSIDYLRSNSSAQLILMNTDHAMTQEVETIWNYTRLFLRI